MEQLSKVANLYFVMIIILQTFPSIRTTRPEIASIPMLTILTVTGLKDALEDWKRHVADKSVNYAKTKILFGGSWRNVNHATTLSWVQLVKQSLRRWHLFSYLKNTNSSSIDPITGASSSPASLNSKTGYKLGDQANSASPQRDPVQWLTCSWRHVRVGDIVCLKKDDPIPADMVILSTSGRNNTCYIETKSLDGETNLKLRLGIDDFKNIQSPGDCTNLEMKLEYENPNSSLYTFQGKLMYNQPTVSSPAELPDNDVTLNNDLPSPNCSEIALGPQNVLLRGCILRNTKWVIGLVIYTGSEAKMILNSGITPTKKSKLDHLMNPMVISNFFILFCLCLTCGILNSFISKTPGTLGYTDDKQFLRYEKLHNDLAQEILQTFFSCLVVFQNIVPISLYITIEFVKTLQVIHRRLFFSKFCVFSPKLGYSSKGEICATKANRSHCGLFDSDSLNYIGLLYLFRRRHRISRRPLFSAYMEYFR
jgi:phospholipid-translocating ATPase